MQKSRSKKPKIKHGKGGIELLVTQGLDQLAEELLEVAGEIDSVAKESSTLEDIEGAKALAADVLEKYSDLMNRLSLDDRLKLQQILGPLVERIKKGFSVLKEAPE